MLLNPKEFKVTDRKGVERTYILSEIPASYSKEIVMQYPTSALPKVGDPAVHMKITLQMLSYVGVPNAQGEPMRLTTRELCDNHIPDLRTWMALERAMAQYNWDFFLPEDLSNFWDRLKRMLIMWSAEMSTTSSLSSSPTEKQPSTNSEPFTA